MNHEWIKAKIIDHQKLTENVIELTVEIHQTLNVIPGQWALFIFKDNIWSFQRAYSIVDQNIHKEKTILIFAIKLLEDGRWSNILKKISINDDITIRWINGHFILQDTQSPKVFVWTGVGIVPVLNMAKYCITKKQLYFSVSNKRDLFYEDKIKTIPGLTSEIYISRESLLKYQTWRIDFTKKHFTLDTEFYICWNPVAVNDIIEKLKYLWYKNIYSEKF